MVKWLVAETGHDIAVVQEFPGKIAHVTFARGVNITKPGLFQKGKLLFMMLGVGFLFLPCPLHHIQILLYSSTLMSGIMLC